MPGRHIRQSAMYTGEHPVRAANRLSRFARREQVQEARDPFLGYVPDLDPAAFGPAGAEACLDILGYNGKLTWDAGFAELTLDSAASNLFPIGDNGSGAIQFASANAQAITAIGMAYIQDPTGSPQDAPFFVTADGGGSQAGHFVTIDSTGDLAEIPYSTAGGSSSGAATPISQDRDTLPDWTFASWGGTTVSNDPAGCVVFAMGTSQPVQIWDLAGDPDGIVGAGFPGAIYDLEDYDSPGGAFKAVSVENFASRTMFFHTVEGANTYINRLRWTALRLLDDANSFTSTGTGFIDLDELQEPGLRALRIGDRLVCYSGDGVVFLERGLLPTEPVRKLYHSSDRGLLATHAVTPISRDLHFGIFTDGWFILDRNGNWTEVGQLEVGGAQLNRFKDNFYDRLDYDNIGRIYVMHVPETDLVRVTFPEEGQTENVSTWTLNLKTGAVWPQSYGVVCWGRGFTPATAATIGSAGGTIGTLGGTIGSYAAAVGHDGTLHGETDGTVYAHDRTDHRRKGFNVAYRYETHYLAGDDPAEEWTMERVYVHRERDSVAQPNINVEHKIDDGSGSAEAVTTTAGQGVETIYADFHATSYAHKVAIWGLHPQKIRAFTLNGQAQESRYKRAEGS